MCVQMVVLGAFNGAHGYKMGLMRMRLAFRNISVWCHILHKATKEFWYCFEHAVWSQISPDYDRVEQKAASHQASG